MSILQTCGGEQKEGLEADLSPLAWGEVAEKGIQTKSTSNIRPIFPRILGPTGPASHTRCCTQCGVLRVDPGGLVSVQPGRASWGAGESRMSIPGRITVCRGPQCRAAQTRSVVLVRGRARLRRILQCDSTKQKQDERGDAMQSQPGPFGGNFDTEPHESITGSQGERHTTTMTDAPSGSRPVSAVECLGLAHQSEVPCSFES